MLDKIEDLKNWQIATIIAIVGLVVFAVGLNSPFQGDDITQIVSNVPVHSITHIKHFFEGGTFYAPGHGLNLYGSYFRPIMTTVFSVIYTVFGPHQFFFHLVQLLIYIGSATLLYLFFKRLLGQSLAFLLAIVFLVHPLNSQVVYSIPNLQDALFFFFGMLGLYVLDCRKSTRSLILVALCLLLSLLSKETGVVFVAISLVYLFLWDKKRLLTFSGIMVLPIALWLILKTHAVGLLGANPNNAPIDSLSLGHRLLTAPSIVSFYITKFIFPWKLATAYYWTYSTFSVKHVLLPLIVDLIALAIGIYLGYLIKKKASKADFLAYIFFAAWTTIGLLLVLQIIPLDMTAQEPWFYFPMAGLLGMIGIVLLAFDDHIHPDWFVTIAAIIILLFGVRSLARGFDYHSSFQLAKSNIAASKEDYTAYYIVSYNLLEQGHLAQAKADAERSASIFPNADTYSSLALILTYEGDYSGAMNNYIKGLKVGGNLDTNTQYEYIAQLCLLYGNPAADKQLMTAGLSKYPNDVSLRMYLALYEAKNNETAAAQSTLMALHGNAQVPQAVYNAIYKGEPLKLPVYNTSVTIP
jgi:tetratricopeptide (TPR) repeat protein